MADNTLGTLFEISADPSKAERALGQFRSNTSTEMGLVRSEFRQTQKEIASWGNDFQKQLLTAGDGISGLQDTAGMTFDRLTQAMGANVSLALLYSKSFSEAMDRALQATTAAITGEAILQTLRSLGLGFYLLATGDFAGSTDAFKAAAIWGSIGSVVGGLSGVLGGSAGTSTSAQRPVPQSGGSPGSAGAAFTLAPGSSPQPSTGSVTVLVMGQPQAAQWLTQIINTGVEHQDLRLVASHTKRSAPAGH